VQGNLRDNHKKIVGRASWLNSFSNNSDFGAFGRGVDIHNALRGVRRVIAEGDAPKKEVPQTPQETERVRSPTMEEILAASRTHVPEFGWEEFQAEIRKLYKQ